MTRAAMSQLDDWELEKDTQDIRGWPVYDRENQHLGTVTDLIGDTDSGYVDTIVLDDRTEVPADAVRISDGTVVVAVGTQPNSSAHDDDAEMIRSREQLRVGTEQVTTGRLQLRKRVVTENASTTVPVSHEEVRVEREPIPAGQRDRYTGQELGEDQAEVTLTAERPVVGTETVPSNASAPPRTPSPKTHPSPAPSARNASNSTRTSSNPNSFDASWARTVPSRTTPAK